MVDILFDFQSKYHRYVITEYQIMNELLQKKLSLNYVDIIKKFRSRERNMELLTKEQITEWLTFYNLNFEL